MPLHFNKAFVLNSIDAWEQDRSERFDLTALTGSFHESVPALGFINWQITRIDRGYAETQLPLTPNSSNQYIAHQGPLMLLAAEYTGGLALASLFHMIPIIGFWPATDNNAGYMWGAKAAIKWLSPSCHNLTCKAWIEPDKWEKLATRFANSDKIVITIPVKMYNDQKLVAIADFTYWTQDLNGLKRNAFDPEKISVLYRHKTRTTAKLIVGLRALEQEKPLEQRRFSDPYAIMLAGKHGITLARRFSIATPQLQNMIAARTMHLDNAVKEFAERTEKFNVVNIGAGYDSRFWRLDIGNAEVFDLDLPVMLNERKCSLDYSTRPSIHNVNIDLEQHRIDTVLCTNKHFNPSLPTFFIWEGGSMYFHDNDIDHVFSAIRNLMAPGSCLWMDYVTHDLVSSATGIREIEGFVTNIRRMGEPFINGYNTIETLAGKYEFHLEENIHCGAVLNREQEIYKHYRFCILKDN
ncbi:SAM-dependent methyltransferase [Prosthecochloris sp. HL-130-GSB]|jgi:methyltransferase (TIGR00027 family)|uniref:SAM-dependent methyltransferase n=1 Tax=Prosthecochloris sp. HL-130-GSB TaxID=1974213 RepID=UPI000A1C0C08|nr:SAM-dependent methyltransferase [Prosthecochloris sp. HL-130-GSB]ARM31104.1 hypothetical protein B9H02_07095 [Prosthecochloris sp. HL-130-GSB]